MRLTYLSVLVCFILPPAAILTILFLLDLRRRSASAFCRPWLPWAALLGHGLLALLYTSPWDNYLVASRVWWYDPRLVTGVTIGYVPIEEYAFFVLQSFLVGSWVLFCSLRLRPCGGKAASVRLRAGTAIVLALIWLASLAILLAGWRKGTYLALIVVWSVPPLALQAAFGADILWRYRRLVLIGLLPPLLYLALVDALAISGGTWVISAEKTVDCNLGGVLPLEELVFFLATTLLLVCGTTLLVARDSFERIGLRCDSES